MHAPFFDPAVHAARRARLREALGSTPVLLVSEDPRPRNYAGNPYPFRASSHFLYFVGLSLPSAALLLEGDDATVFCRPKTTADALWHGDVATLDELAERSGCRCRPLSDLADRLRDRDLATVPAVDLATRLAQSRWLARPVDFDALTEADTRLVEAIIALRLVHDEGALAGLRRAAEATAHAHRAGMEITRPGLFEASVRAAMEAELVARDMRTAYGSIVTVEGDVLHADTHHRRLAEGDLLLADVGAEAPDGWAADVTRTWPVTGRFSATQRIVYDVVLAAQKAAIAEVRPGVRYRDVHLAACRSLAENLVALGVLRGDPETCVAEGAVALLFPHGIGHLLGLDVHDMEDLGDRAGYAPGRTRSSQFGLSYLRLDRDLVPGMAVTIEPGFYRVPAILQGAEFRSLADRYLDREELAKFSDVRGIRIEDDVLVTTSDPEVLTAAIPKRPEEVEDAVRGARP